MKLYIIKVLLEDALEEEYDWNIHDPNTNAILGGYDVKNTLKGLLCSLEDDFVVDGFDTLFDVEHVEVVAWIPAILILNDEQYKQAVLSIKKYEEEYL